MEMRRRGFVRCDHLVAKESNAIFLADLHVAEMSYHQGMEPEVLAKLRVGDKSVLRREPDNP